MKLSSFGQLLTSDAPIVQLMDDLGEALNQNPNSLFLGGGNPACVPLAQPIFQAQLSSFNAKKPHHRLGVYQSPQGNEDVLQAVAGYLKAECDWQVSSKNLALVSGSQTAFFILLNAFAGEQAKVILPLVPEYLGYGSQVLAENAFVANRPSIQETAAKRFKYSINFDQLELTDAGVVCVSSPANPSGNVLGRSDFTKLAALALAEKVPFIVDYAYGLPFPGLVFDQHKPFWQEGTIAVLSLSKLGLPGVRCSVVVADPAVIELVARANTIMSLAGGNLGPTLLKQLIASGDMQRLSRQILPDFYRQSRDFFVALIDKYLAGYEYVLHEPEGAFFVWLWLPSLSVSATVFYDRLKARGVIVMPGEPFFFGLQKSWPHARQCIRLSYCQPEAVLTQAIKLIADELRLLDQ